MKIGTLLNANSTAMCAVAIVAIAGALNAQAPGARGGRGGFGGGRGGVAPALFTALDTDKDGSVTRGEMEAAFDAWFTSWDAAKTGSLTHDQLVTGLAVLFPAPAPPADGVGGVFNPRGNSQPLTAKQSDIDAMMAALPSTPGAKPMRPRRVLVLAHTGPGGFVHAS